MKAQKMKTFIFLLLALIYHIKTDANTAQVIVHDDSEYPKVYALEDQSVLVITSDRGVQKSTMTLLDPKGNIIFANTPLANLSFTGNAGIIQTLSANGAQSKFLISHHNKQNLPGQSPNEFLSEFNQQAVTSSTKIKGSLYQQRSLVALKSGKVFMAGIEPPTAFGANVNVTLDIYDPINKKFGNGISFNDASSKYISCFELTKDNVYCVYVSFENSFVTKLRIKHIKISNMTLRCEDKENKQIIKTFYTVFNFIKAIKFNDKEAIVLFQTGNTNNPPRYGNSGKDLYYYHLEINEDSVHVKRYEYLYDGCLYREDAEDYNADIAVLSEKRVYVTCETESGRLRGFAIYPDKEEWDEFNFNNFDAEYVKNPTFVKFEKSLGLFYTYVGVNQNSKVAYQIMNYPDCKNYRDGTITLPKYTKMELDFSGKVFIINAYPADRQNEEIYVRFQDLGNFVLTNSKGNIEVNKDYSSLLRVNVTSDGSDGVFSLLYTATRMDSLDGQISGRTCKINLNTPRCLPQCYSCAETGDDISHKCLLDCAEGPYYRDVDPKQKETDYWGYTFNCPRCDKSCSSCYGPFLFKPINTTNCKKCDYNNGYYHFVDDERTCISEETQDDWEKYFGHAIYLDKNHNSTNKTTWRWKYCHPNCRKCHGPGTNDDNQCDVCKKDLYFYCNQTIGNGIPGSCHNDCVDNGFTLEESEGMQKCCPCAVKECKVCRSNPYCDNCFPPFFRNPDNLSCVPECGYCLAGDRNTWKCVNCKKEYKEEKYNLNGTCVDKSQLAITPYYPDPYFEGREHHVVDDTCNLVWGCKEGCFKCNPWYTENCTECSKGYYKEDFYSETQPETFSCFTEDECKGTTLFQYDHFKRIGGVPTKINNELVCYNCLLREGNCRQADEIVCGPRARRTYIDIPRYCKLSNCYARCASCDDWGNSCFHNCTSCRDSGTYGLVLYDPPNGKYGNCIRYSHKCKGLPYYHDYDLAEKLGLDEDNCGQDCDVCLTNGTCTENYPFYVIETRECVELCPFNEVLTKTCLMGHPNAGFIFLKNPFDTQNIFNPINQNINIKQLVSNTFFETFIKYYNISISNEETKIFNNLGTGQIINLQNSQIIVGNNISLELTSVGLELEKIKQLGTQLFGSLTTEKKEDKTSAIDLSECQKILKEKYGLPSEEDIMIIKGDTLKELSLEYLGNQVDYQLFSYSLGAFLPLNDCKAKEVEVTVSNPFKIENLIQALQSKTSAAISDGYDVFDSKSPFYHDICTPFTNENGNDVLIDDRQADYFSNTKLCEKGCTFVSYNATTNYYTCNCPIKDSINQQLDASEDVSQKLPESFYKKHKYSNIEVFKCSSQVFSSKGQKKNFGSYVLIACIASFIGSVVFYFIKGTLALSKTFDDLAENPIPANPPKNESKTSERDIKGKKTGYKDCVMNEEQLNNAPYGIAEKHDDRGYLRLYWSLLKIKQIFIFTFYTCTDYNIRVLKIALFILFFAFYFAFTALFFNDSIMREIYKYKGNTNAAIHVPNIILSSLCCIIMNFIVRFVTLSERDISKINCETNPDNKKKLCKSTEKILKIKVIILFAVSFILLGICWYYVSAFCAVFKNSQGHYFVNVFISFLVCNLWPCMTSLIPPIFRKQGIKNKSPCMYKASQIIAYF